MDTLPSCCVFSILKTCSTKHTATAPKTRTKLDFEKLCEGLFNQKKNPIQTSFATLKRSKTCCLCSRCVPLSLRLDVRLAIARVAPPKSFCCFFCCFSQPIHHTMYAFNGNSFSSASSSSSSSTYQIPCDRRFFSGARVICISICVVCWMFGYRAQYRVTPPYSHVHTYN